MYVFKIIIAVIIIYLDYGLRAIIIKINTENKNTKINPYYSKDLNGKILFMRHGETVYNADAHKDPIDCLLNPNYIDSKLNQVGINQAKSKRDILNSLSFEKVYTSPLYRALQTLTYSLQNHPNKKNIIVLVHPYVSELANYIPDYILDIKKTKKDFNLNSIIKVDWSLFDEYVKGIKYEENFYYFDNFDCFDEKEKNNMYLKLKYYYDNGNMKKLKMGLSELANLRFEAKIRFESLMHAQGRVIKFIDYIKKNHKNTMKNKNEKILVFSHSSFMTLASNRTLIESKEIQNFNRHSYSPKNCEILSYII